MKKQYPYLQDSYFRTTLEEEREKRSILDDIQNFVNQRQYIKMTLLDWQERPIKDIEGIISSGSITKNGSSPVRRSANLSCAVDARSYNFTDLKSDFAINKKIFIEVGILNETDKYPDYPIFWFPEGVFFISSFSMNSSSTSAVNINLTLKDKMAMLNGEMGGTLPAMTTFDSMDTQLPDGSYATKKVLIYNIIKELVNHYGSEDLNNIVIEDVPLRIRRVIRWNGSTPLYRIGTPEIAQLDSNSQTNCEFSLTKPAGDSGYITYNQGDDVGYIRDDFVITGELVGNAGETVVAILDKIKNILGNYEYFYDIFGVFHFREIKNYLNTTQGKIELADMAEKDYLMEINNEKSIFTFSDKTLLTSITATPLYENIKNDFIVQGTQENTSTGMKNDIRYHLVVDTKPRPQGIDNREYVQAIQDHTEDSEKVQRDIQFLQQLLNYYKTEQQQYSTNKTTYQSVLNQRLSRLKKWGDEVKRALTLSLEEYGIPAEQIIKAKILSSTISEYKYNNAGTLLIPDFYSWTFIDSLLPKADDAKFNEELKKNFKKFNKDIQLTQTIFDNLTPEGYWKIISNTNFHDNAVSTMRNQWADLVFEWNYGVYQVRNNIEGWKYTNKNKNEIETNEHLFISKPVQLTTTLNNLIQALFDEAASSKKLNKSDFKKAFNNYYKKTPSVFTASFTNYWNENYNQALYSSNTFNGITLNNLCTNLLNIQTNIPKIFLRHDKYTEILAPSNIELKQQLQRNWEWAFEGAKNVQTRIIDLWNNASFWKNGSSDITSKTISWTVNYSSAAGGGQETVQLNIYKGKYTDVEKELAGYKQQEKEYRKGLNDESLFSSVIAEAISLSNLTNKFKTLNYYYLLYLEEANNVAMYKKKIEELDSGDYGKLTYRVRQDVESDGDYSYTDSIINHLESKNLVPKKMLEAIVDDQDKEKLINNSRAIKILLDGTLSANQNNKKIDAIEWLTKVIDLLARIKGYWDKYPEIDMEKNTGHQGKPYYGYFDDRILVLYVDQFTKRIRAGFAYPQEGLPAIGNFNLVYKDGDNFYKWNGTGYTKLEIKGVYNNDTNSPIDASNRTTYLIYDWRTLLYLAGEYAHVFGGDTGYYYQELAAFWNQTYDLVHQKFIGAKDEETLTPKILTTGTYFLDFLDSIETNYGEYSVDNIGRRTDIVVSDEVNCLFQPEIPNVNLLDVSRSNKTNDEIYDTNAEIPDSLRYLENIYPGLVGQNKQYYLRAESVNEHEPYVQVPEEIYANFMTGGYANGAYDQIKYELFLHTRYQNSISLTAIPVFYLEPNNRITIADNTTNTFGDYILQNINITFGPGANMSISCTEAAERF